MKKNVAGQVIGSQMISATDGSAFTSAVTCYVTLDGGTQAQGSVGSGACTHEGNGFHTYAPSQAETNGDHVAFTFVGTGAVPVTVQVYTNFPQTGDSYARLGAPAGASLSADVATIDTVVDAIKAKTDSLTFTTANKIDARVDAVGANAVTSPDDFKADVSALATAAALATVDANVDAVLVDTGTDIPATLSTIAGYIDTEIAAIKAKTDQLTFTVANKVDSTPTLTDSQREAIADALLNRNINGGGNGTRTVEEALAFLRNKWSVSGTTLTVYDVDDSTTLWTATVTATAGADPITANDPA